MKKAVTKTLRWLALFTLRAYQAFLGPFLGGACKFQPSCSVYAYEAIERFGAARGSWLALRRLLRCRPFSPGGFDPVPEKIEQHDNRSTEASQRVASPHDGRAVEVLR